MKLLAAAILILWVCSAQCVLLGDLKQPLIFQMFGNNCQCQDKTRNCFYFRGACATSVLIAAMCPRTCSKCLSCRTTTPAPTTVEPTPTTTSTMNPCKLTCEDRMANESCLQYKEEGRCSLMRNYCESTCGYCRECVLPSVEPCREDCEDMEEAYKCREWLDAGMCLDDSFSDIRYVCQRTCNMCNPCSIE